VPKVHNKPIKRPRKGFKQESKRQPGRHPGLAHRTVRCATGQCPVHQDTRGWTLHLQKFPRALRYNSLDCPVCQRSNGFFCANGHLQRHLLRARARRSQARARRRTRQSTRLVRCTTGQPGGPTRHSSNGRTPTVCYVAGAPDSVCWRTGLSGAPCDCSLPTATLWWLGL
jgi:hypothetical protein